MSINANTTYVASYHTDTGFYASNNDFFRWCLSAGLRIAKPMTLMTTGFYQEPKSPWYPSVEY